MIRHHPDEPLMAAFLAGSLPMGFNLAISAHVDCCRPCQRRFAELAERTSADWVHDPSPGGDDLTPLLDRIMALPPDAPSRPVTSERSSGFVKVHDEVVELPMVLADIANEGLSWKRIGKGIHQALLNVDTQTKCELIRLEPGVRVPRHGHMGQEIMLVLSGHIVDDWDTYGRTDFVHYTRNHCHGQVSDNGCLCLFVTDAPLKFTEGLPRLLNPLNYAKFWLQQRRA